MNKYKLLETTGFIIIVVGFLFIFAKRLIDHPIMDALQGKEELMFWLGLLLWALGNLLNKNHQAKTESE